MTVGGRLLLLLLALLATPARAGVASASSPGGTLRVAVSLDDLGRPA